jgi:7,8-dihydroneopterin aldolase/epimerase/oxygenase
MIAVHLKNITFHAHHGLYEGEEKTGGRFEVNLTAWYDPKGRVTTLEQTINYVVLFEIVKEQMQLRSGLIEKVAENICETIKTRFPVITEIMLDIYKSSPPIENFNGKVGITLHKHY